MTGKKEECTSFNTIADMEGNVLNPEDTCANPDCPLSDPDNVAKATREVVTGQLAKGKSAVSYSKTYADNWGNIFGEKKVAKA